MTKTELDAREKALAAVLRAERAAAAAMKFFLRDERDNDRNFNLAEAQLILRVRQAELNALAGRAREEAALDALTGRK